MKCSTEKMTLIDKDQIVFVPRSAIFAFTCYCCLKEIVRNNCYRRKKNETENNRKKDGKADANITILNVQIKLWNIL